MTLLTLCLLPLTATAGRLPDTAMYVGHDRCLRIRDERSMARCLLRTQRTLDGARRPYHTATPLPSLPVKVFISPPAR